MKLKPSEIADTICQIVADQHEVTLEDMKAGRGKTGPRGVTRVSDARVIAMDALRSCTNMTFQHIGEYMGGRHHSSAIWAVGKAKEIRERSLSIK